MKNIAITSSLLMLLGSAIAQPAISRRHHHQHHRRNAAVKYCTITTTITHVLYRTLTEYVDDKAVAAATPTPEAGAVLVQAPKEEDKEEEKNEYVAPAPAPAPPADDKKEEPPKEQPKEEYKEEPKPQPKEETKASVPGDIISEQDKKNKEQQKINEEMEKKNKEHQEQMDNLQNGGGSSYPVQDDTPEPAPAPVAPAPSPPQTGGGGDLKIGGNGHATFYEPGPGACGWMNTDDEMVCAISKEIFDKTTPNGNPNNNPLCGTFIRASYGGASVRLKVVDRCGGCKTDQDVDMSSSAFKKLADLGVGRLTDLKWESCE